MDGCLRSKLLGGGVGKSQKTCGEGKTNQKVGIDKESGCCRRMGLRAGGAQGAPRRAVPANASSLAGGLSARVGEACGGEASGEAVSGDSHCG
jgi:hypothetical protein